MEFNEDLRRAVERGELGIRDLSLILESFIDKGQRESLVSVIETLGLGVTDDREPWQKSKAETMVTASTGIGHGATGVLSEPDGVTVSPPAVPQSRTASSIGSKPPSKFELMEELARGGVGAIRRIRDKELRRNLVVKTLLDGTSASEYVFKKFIEEAQITAQLEHPNIVPVHEFGYFSGGEVFFTMKHVQGQTLKAVIRGLRKGDEAIQSAFPRLRLIRIFEQVCMAIGFAHSRGVIHRDIKPSNIMVGDFGQTLVLDWGVAKVLGRQEADEPEAEHVSTGRSESDDSTMVGLITGTPSYMAPEQAAGKTDRLDQRSDVYALGALLYEILVYRPPFRKKTHRETLRSVIKERPVPPVDLAPEQNIPLHLQSICMRCLEKRPSNRYQSVTGIIDDLNHYLKGVEDLDRRARLSQAKSTEGLEHIEKLKRTRANAANLKNQVMELEWSMAPHAPLEEKRRLWKLEAALSEAEMQLSQAFAAGSRAFVEAIGFDPENHDACNELARLYWIRLKEAQERNADDDVRHYRALVEAYNRGLFTEQLKGEARLIVRTDPPGARVVASRLVEIDHKMTPLMEEDLGLTPIHNMGMGEGRWLITMQFPGHREINQVIRLHQGDVVDLVGRFFTEEHIGSHFLYVPGGRISVGGDPTCVAARHQSLVEVKDFFMARYPVTCAEYLSFLRDLARKDPDGAAARAPRVRNGGVQLWTPDSSGVYQLPQVDGQGLRWDPHWPVMGISFDDAKVYCSWYGARTSQRVRLPTEYEWEKAGRSGDGRLYPWGDYFEPTYCKMALSRVGQPAPEKVGQFGGDRSPYGIYDLAGLVSEYCDSDYSAAEHQKVGRGGNYQTTGAVQCRLTHRHPVQRDQPSLIHGFRLVRDPA